MEMLITPEWLRNKTESEQVAECEAGMAVEALESIGMFLPRDRVKSVDEPERVSRLKLAFGIFIRNLRLKKKISREELARQAAVEIKDIFSIETDPHYQPRPRTVYQLAKFFDIEPQKMMGLSGVTQVYDEELEEEAFKFAAKSSGVSSLNKEEQTLLNEFVKYLNRK